MQVKQDEFLAGLVNGDEKIIDHLLNIIIRWASKSCSLNQQDAEDVAQNTVVSAYQNVDSYKGDAPFLSWFFAIAVNMVNRLYRKKVCPYSQKAVCSLEEINSASLDEDPEEITLLRMYLAEAKSVLTEREKQVMEMRIEQDMDAPTTAEALGISINGVYCAQYRGLAKLRDALGVTVD